MLGFSRAKLDFHFPASSSASLARKIASFELRSFASPLTASIACGLSGTHTRISRRPEARFRASVLRTFLALSLVRVMDHQSLSVTVGPVDVTHLSIGI